MDKFQVIIKRVVLTILGLSVLLTGPALAKSDPFQLLEQMRSNSKNERLSATQQMITNFTTDQQAIRRALSYLDSNVEKSLSIAARSNYLVFLNRVKATTWAKGALEEGKRVQAYLSNRPLGPKTKLKINELGITLSSVTGSNRGVVVPPKDPDIDPDGYLPKYDKKVALLIGISNYDNWPQLNSIPNELDKLDDALKTKGFEVTKVLNTTRNQTRDALNDFVDNFGFDDNNQMLIFFAGHGHTRTTKDDIKKGYIVPRDAPSPSSSSFARKAISMDEIQTLARKIESKHALFIFDSCFSGSAFKSRSNNAPKYINSMTSRPVRQFITAGSADQEVPATSSFIDYLVRALRYNTADFNRDSYTTGTELGQYLHQEITNLPLNQTPQYGKIKDSKLDLGEFVFFP